ncbi:MAG: imidazole glycerol phosphate synthase subunit HisH [Chloroflexi bacterium]|nr:imidazole glycerol phosphate synthase subunit HisH [Chloroflexota bacterium]
MIAIVDYGMGNLRSVQKAFEKIGADARVIQSPDDLRAARGIVLPGVGAFGQAMQNLRAAGWIEPLRAACARGAPFIGICLGMQLLFESSEEMGEHTGLGILPGVVRRFTGDLKVPQMGWNQIHIQAKQRSPVLRGVRDGSYAFFVHSFYCAPRDPALVLATTEYGIEFASVVGRGNIFGAQFHPEKSQSVGLKMLENFAEIVSGK